MIPSEHERWRCGSCGNLTRFDVTRTRKTKEFWHFDLGGGLRVEAEDVLGETFDEVRCRWCGRADAIELSGTSADKTDRPPE